MSGLLAITGATGLLGRAILAGAGGLGPVRALVRPGSEPPRGVQVVYGDLDDDDALASLVQGAGVVLHLAAAMGAASDGALHRVNIEGTERLLSAALTAGVPRFVFTSSVAAAHPEMGPYSRTKAVAEQHVLEAALDGVVLRLPVLFGPGSQVERALLGLARRLPVVPVIGGEALRPMHVGDAALACIAAVERPGITGRFTLAGAESVEFADFASRLLRARGVRRPAVGLPPLLFLLAARGLEVVGRGGVSVESVRAAARGTPPASPNLHELGWAPRPLGERLMA